MVIQWKILSPFREVSGMTIARYIKQMNCSTYHGSESQNIKKWTNLTFTYVFSLVS